MKKKKKSLFELYSELYIGSIVKIPTRRFVAELYRSEIAISKGVPKRRRNVSFYRMLIGGTREIHLNY